LAVSSAKQLDKIGGICFKVRQRKVRTVARLLRSLLGRVDRRGIGRSRGGRIWKAIETSAGKCDGIVSGRDLERK
jgi:hypothetical protein